ncbi:MAG: hypothetical protein U1F16_05560 [Turneriella sp.]
MASVVASLLLEIPVPDSAKATAQRYYTDIGGTKNVLIQHASPDALKNSAAPVRLAGGLIVRGLRRCG